MALTPEQLALRRNGIGGSDIPAVAGIDPHKGALAVYLDKKELSTFTGNHHTERGDVYEPAVKEWCWRRWGWAIEEPGTLVHPEYPLCMATPDGIVNGTHVLEIKCPYGISERAWGTPETNEVPAHYQVQVQWTMAVTGLKHAYVVATLRGDIARYHLEFDPVLFEKLRRSAEGFWHKHILANVPPDVDGTKAADEYLAKLFPEGIQEPVDDDTPQMFDLARLYAQASAAAKDAKRTYDTIAQSIKQRIGDTSAVRGEWGMFTYKNNKSTPKTDWRAVATEVDASQDIIDKHTVDKPGPRVLRPYLKDEK